MFYSQAGQDEWVVKLLKNKRNGYFVDIGAYDGIDGSNTYYLEKELGWKGLCVEAHPQLFYHLTRRRHSININVAVTDYNGKITFGKDSISNTGNLVPCKTLKTILKLVRAPKKIDYLSIDVEGHEYTIFKDFDFENWDISLMTVEHNLYCLGPENKERNYELLSSKGFVRVVEDAPCLDPNPSLFNQPLEDWYASKKFLEENESFV